MIKVETKVQTVSGNSLWSSADKTLKSLIGLNHRPLGYEGKSAHHAMPNFTARCKEPLENLPLLLPHFASFCPPFTDRKRTVKSTGCADALLVPAIVTSVTLAKSRVGSRMAGSEGIMAGNKSKSEKTRVADFVADSMHEIANHSSSPAEEIHKQADHARQVGSTKIVNVGTTKTVSRPPFEEDGQWYYETRSLAGTETHGPFATKAEAFKDLTGR